MLFIEGPGSFLRPTISELWKFLDGKDNNQMILKIFSSESTIVDLW